MNFFSTIISLAQIKSNTSDSDPNEDLGLGGLEVKMWVSHSFFIKIIVNLKE